MDPTMTGRTRADFQVDLTLADPYFYGPAITATIANGGSVNVWNPGNDYAIWNGLKIVFNGHLDNPVLTNESVSPRLTLKIGSVISSGHNVTTIPGSGIATVDGSRNITGAVSHTGARHWFGLAPGLNHLTLSGGTGNNGSCTVSFQPPYI
jgi:hypothetical protein